MTTITHNIVLSFDGALSQKFIDFAQANFASHADGYCVSENTIPHITLAQTEIENSAGEKSLTIFLESINSKMPNPDPVNLSYRFGENEHTGKLWAEISIRRNSSLLNLHNSICGQLEKLGLTIINASRDLFHPHITFCRLDIKNPIPQVKIPDTFSCIFKGELFLALGKSDANGQLADLLWKKKVSA